MKKFVIVVVAVLSLVAASCKSSGDDVTSTSSSKAPSTELGRGVTADSITLGVSYLDLTALKDILPSLDHGDYASAIQSLADVINQDGGINGRRLNLVFAKVDPIKNESNQAACLKLTEDTETFAVLVAGLSASGTKCVVDDHATPVIGGLQTPQELATAKAPWFAVQASSASGAEKTVRGVLAEGSLKGKKVAVVAGASDTSVADDTAQQLRDGGVEVTGVAIGTDSGDVAAARAELQTFAERFKADGADAVIVIDQAFVLFAQALEKTDYRPQLVATATNQVRGYLVQASDLTVLDGLISGGTPDQADAFAELPTQECVARIKSVEPDRSIAPPDEASAKTPDTFVSVVTACQLVELFQAIAEKAGATLNIDTFGEAGRALGEIELPSLGGPSDYTPEHPDGNAPLFLSRWNAAEQRLVSSPDPVQQ